MLIPILIFIAASIVLVKSASYAIRSIAKISLSLRLSGFFAAFVIAGLVSILPELFIGINAALIDQPAVGIATIIGSNVADLTIVIAVIALLGRKIIVDTKTLSNNGYFVLITGLPILLMLDNELSRDDGLLLIMAFLFYLYHIIRQEKIVANAKRADRSVLAKQLAIFVAAMVVLFAAAHFMVESGIAIAHALDAPVVLVGLFLIALGTTLPELTFSVRAVLAKHKEIALGDILGNVAIDSTFTIGIVALLAKTSTSFLFLITAALFMVLSALVVATLMKSGRRITWDESFVLLFIYGMFIVMELLIKGTVAV